MIKVTEKVCKLLLSWATFCSALALSFSGGRGESRGAQGEQSSRSLGGDVLSRTFQVILNEFDGGRALSPFANRLPCEAIASSSYLPDFSVETHPTWTISKKFFIAMPKDTEPLECSSPEGSSLYGI